VSGKRTLPLFMEVTHIMTALAVTVTIASAAVRPFGRPFKVTDKGGDRSASKVRWKMASGFGAISALSAASIVWSFVSPYGASEISPLDYFNLLWAGVAMLFTFVAFLVCFERSRGAEEFPIARESKLRIEGAFYDCGLISLGMHSATVALRVPLPLGRLALHFEPTGWINARPDRVEGGTCVLRLEPNADQRRTLLLRLFTNAADPIARTANLGTAVKAVVRRAFRPA
jgi:cellulose synthase (UDP-forming)